MSCTLQSASLRPSSCVAPATTLLGTRALLMLLLCSKASLKDSGQCGCNIRIAFGALIIVQMRKVFFLKSIILLRALPRHWRARLRVYYNHTEPTTCLLQAAASLLCCCTLCARRHSTGTSLHAEAGACTGTGLCKATKPECKIAPYNFSFVGSAVVAQ